ncbi:protein-export membrane protein SecD [Desulfurispirillum indicum S5]|uniref:Protein translocase subunit SecD n=1 Tax=Desulfurispirillum indicum (strain ATCC BAA-1389 / DSM 22839 / S5) TaxID=653733 RepID=SECD_DESIS|nr:protein translocase subunit SecD [Desulfurispirillum indicum]E6W4K8.1 RecName: Full=Protein translocase subunit SecD [Desulfurispirillum indicum S5]ADU67081.1 protein-export membrane protein SecD [Desulfurispirillum indicum S5]
MDGKLIAKLLLIAAVIGFCIHLATPLNEKIALGLDLQGGMHLALDVDTEQAVERKLDAMTNALRLEAQQQHLVIGTIQRRGMQILIPVPYAEEKAEFKRLMQRRYGQLELQDEQPELLVYGYTTYDIEEIKELAVGQALETIRNRIDQFGVSEPTVQKQGDRRIIIELPGVEDVDRAVELIGRTAMLEFRLVNENVSTRDALDGFLPENSEVLYQRHMDPQTNTEVDRTPFVLYRDVIFTGDRLLDARVRFDPQFNTPYVSITLDGEGARLFADVTGRNVGRRLAIVLDGHVHSAPVINERIPSGQASISGQFTMEQATDLSIVLRSGSLPAPVDIVENRTVGPTLGQDSIDKGILSVTIGMALVLLFMVAYYRLSGLLANMALLMNLIILMGLLAYFGATLTLPGIAGIILTIGIAVDANVLIFERIREELRRGASPRLAIEEGYAKAFSTILDANITTLIVAVILFQFGTGPIKGFAVTLSIGILASMFTAILCTRAIYELILVYKPIRKLSI